MQEVLVSPEDTHLLQSGDWFITTQGYVRRNYRTQEGRRHELLHRVILKPETGMVVDHINGIATDNRRENLRVCSPTENARNSRTRSHNKLGVKGVYLDRKSGTYRAQITADGRQVHLGSFKSVAKAKEAYDKAAMKLHGDFARLQ